jgi:hypothetical protein
MLGVFFLGAIYFVSSLRSCPVSHSIFFVHRKKLTKKDAASIRARGLGT